jgi:hypothetical protein
MKGTVKARNKSTAMGIGSKKLATKYGDSTGLMCDNEGAEIKQAKVSEVALLPSS